jgi:protein MpaA
LTTHRQLRRSSSTPRLLLAGIAAVSLATTAQASTTEIIGRSVLGRPIVVYRVGDPHAAHRVLVVGCIHGDECVGFPIIAKLRRSAPIPGVELWLVPSVNPDGRRAHTRGNAHGVDLNRNFSVAWRRIPRSSRYYSGPRPFSEPESRVVRDLVTRMTPSLSIWFHQPERTVRDADRSPLAQRYARYVGLPFRPLATPPGSATAWTKARVRGAQTFTVEFAGGDTLSAAQVRRHVYAVRAVAFSQAR